MRHRLVVITEILKKKKKKNLPRTDARSTRSASSRARSGARSWRHFGLALSLSRRVSPSVPKDDHQHPGERRLAPRTNVVFSKGEALKYPLLI